MPYAYSRAAAWLVGVNWNMFYPLLRALEAVGHTYAAYGVARDNITTGAPGDEKAEIGEVILKDDAVISSCR